MCLAPWQALEDKSEQYKRRAHGQALVTTQALNLINRNLYEAKDGMQWDL